MNDLLPSVVADNVVVSLDYTLLVDGNIIDSSSGSAPLDYLHGHHNIIPGLEKALNGMSSGQSAEVLVNATDGYGEVDPDAFAEVERNQFPPDFDLKVGAPLHVRAGNGSLLNARIDQIGDEFVRLDLNHPLAGKDLLFKATIVGLRSATEEELQNGRIGGCASCGSSGCGDSGCGSGCC